MPRSLRPAATASMNACVIPAPAPWAKTEPAFPISMSNLCALAIFIGSDSRIRHHGSRNYLAQTAVTVAAAVPSFDNLVRAYHDRLGQGQAERLGGLEINGKFESRRLLDGKISRFSALQYLVHIGRRHAIHFWDVRPIRHEAARSGELTIFVHRRNSVAHGKIENPVAMAD